MLYHEIRSKLREITIPEQLDGCFKVYLDLPTTIHKLVNSIDGDLLINKNKPSKESRLKKAELEQIIRDIENLNQSFKKDSN